MRYLALLSIMLTLTGCIRFWDFRDERVVDTDELTRIIQVFSEKMKYEKHLDLDDAIIRQDKYINGVKLQYSSMDSLNLCDARALLVDVVDEFLDRVNQNSLIYPNLGTTPFPPENLEIYIHFVSFYNYYCDSFRVGMISLRNGVTNIVATDAFDCDTDCWHRRYEYFSQSRKFVAGQRQGAALYKPTIEEVTPGPFEEERFIPPKKKESQLRLNMRNYFSPQ